MMPQLLNRLVRTTSYTRSPLNALRSSSGMIGRIDQSPPNRRCFNSQIIPRLTRCGLPLLNARANSILSDDYSNRSISNLGVRKISTCLAISGDPITLGHLGVLAGAIKLAEMDDVVIVSIGNNPEKASNYLFNQAERVELTTQSIEEWLENPCHQTDPELQEKIQLIQAGKIKLEVVRHKWLPDTVADKQIEHDADIFLVRGAGARSKRDAQEESGFTAEWRKELSKRQYQGLKPEIINIELPSTMNNISSTEEKREHEIYALNRDNPRGKKSWAYIENVLTPSVLNAQLQLEPRLLDLETQKRMDKLRIQLVGTESFVVTGTTGGGKSTAVEQLMSILSHINVASKPARFDEDEVTANAFNNVRVVSALFDYLEEKGIDITRLMSEGAIDKSKVRSFMRESEENRKKVVEITIPYFMGQMREFIENNSDRFKIFDAPRYAQLIQMDWFKEIGFSPDHILFMTAEPEISIDRVQGRPSRNSVRTNIGLQAEYPVSVWAEMDPVVGLAVGRELMWNRLLRQEASMVVIDTTHSDEGALKRDIEESLLQNQ